MIAQTSLADWPIELPVAGTFVGVLVVAVRLLLSQQQRQDRWTDELVDENRELRNELRAMRAELRRQGVDPDEVPVDEVEPADE